MTSAIPAHIETYVEILGSDLAVEFFLQFGGSEIYLSKSPQASMVLNLTGSVKFAMLCEKLGAGHVRLPIPKSWIAQCLFDQGLSKAGIARRLHVDQRTVGRWFAKHSETSQLCFFEDT